MVNVGPVKALTVSSELMPCVMKALRMIAQCTPVWIVANMYINTTTMKRTLWVFLLTTEHKFRLECFCSEEEKFRTHRVQCEKENNEV